MSLNPRRLNPLSIYNNPRNSPFFRNFINNSFHRHVLGNLPNLSTSVPFPSKPPPPSPSFLERYVAPLFRISQKQYLARRIPLERQFLNLLTDLQDPLVVVTQDQLSDLEKSYSSIVQLIHSRFGQTIDSTYDGSITLTSLHQLMYLLTYKSFQISKDRAKFVQNIFQDASSVFSFPVNQVHTLQNYDIVIDAFALAQDPIMISKFVKGSILHHSFEPTPRQYWIMLRSFLDQVPKLFQKNWILMLRYLGPESFNRLREFRHLLLEHQIRENDLNFFQTLQGIDRNGRSMETWKLILECDCQNPFFRNNKPEEWSKLVKHSKKNLEIRLGHELTIEDFPNFHPPNLNGKTEKEIMSFYRQSYWKTLLKFTAKGDGLEETKRIFDLAVKQMGDETLFSKYLFQSFDPQFDRKIGESVLQVIDRIEKDSLGPSYKATQDDISGLFKKFVALDTTESIQKSVRDIHFDKIQDAIYLYDHTIQRHRILKNKSIATGLLFRMEYLWDPDQLFHLPSTSNKLSRWQISQLVYRDLLQTSIAEGKPFERDVYHRFLLFAFMAGGQFQKVNRHWPTPLLLAKQSMIEIPANPQPLTGVKKEAKEFSQQLLQQMIKESYHVPPSSAGKRTKGIFVRAMMKALAFSYKEAFNAFTAVYDKEKRIKLKSRLPLKDNPVFNIKEYSDLLEYFTSLSMQDPTPPPSKDQIPIQSDDWRALLGLDEGKSQEVEIEHRTKFVPMNINYLEDVLENMQENNIVPTTYIWTLFLNHFIRFIPDPHDDGTPTLYADTDCLNMAFDGIHAVHRLSRAHRGYKFDRPMLYNLIICYGRMEAYDFVFSLWQEFVPFMTNKDLPFIERYFKYCIRADSPEKIAPVLDQLPASVSVMKVGQLAVNILSDRGHWLTATELIFSNILKSKLNVQKELIKVLIRKSGLRETELAQKSHEALKKLAIENWLLLPPQLEELLQDVKREKEEMTLTDRSKEIRPLKVDVQKSNKEIMSAWSEEHDWEIEQDGIALEGRGKGEGKKL